MNSLLQVSKPSPRPTSKLVILIALCVFLCIAGLYLIFSPAPASYSQFALEESEFHSYMAKHEKFYSTLEEYEYRFLVFRSNAGYIRRFNQDSQDVVLGLNSFSDLSVEEFRETYLPPRIERPIKPSRLSEKAPEKLMAIPNSVNWVQQGAVTSVKNEGDCWSNWAFSAAGAIEGMWKIAGHPLADLSVQQLVDCSFDQGNNGCNGGLMDFGFDYVIKHGGLTNSTLYPYNATENDCSPMGNITVANISSYVDVTANSSQSLLNALAMQPVAVAVCSDPTIWQSYQGGVVSRNCATVLDRGVLAVGYNLLSNPPYYLVKNSWGSRWGEQGYIRLAIVDGVGVCGIQIEPSYPVA